MDVFTRPLETFLDILFPKKCAGCGLEGSFCCPTCSLGILPVGSACFVCEIRSPHGFMCEGCRPKTRLRRFISAFRYQDPIIRELTATAKYRGAKEICQMLARYLADAVRDAGSIISDAVLVPIPLHAKRLRERGFNQSELIAEELGRLLGIKSDLRVLERTEYRKPQTEMNRREERIKNAEGVYRATRQIQDKLPYILVDDVSTTGATLEEAARVLKKAGAKKVWAFTVAR